jgi:signal transduction histidine kinase
VQRDGFKFLNSALRHNTLNSINIITGTAGNLQKEVTDEQKEQLELIEEQGKAIAELIENAGVLADFFAADSTVEKEINLSEILHNEVQLIQHSNDRVRVETDIESDVTIEATPLINAAFQNLLSNAVEYNDSPEPRLEVSLKERAELSIVEIKDNGPGIAKDKLQQFLNPGYHSEHMGLYISEKLVKHLKGEFEISNNEPQGTIVSIRLPT